MATPEETAALEAAKTAEANKQSEETKNKEFAPVPYTRFEEVNREKNELAKKLKEREDADKADTEKRLAEQNEFKTIADNRAKELAELKPKAAQVEAYEKTLQEVLDAQVKDIPEDKRGLIPDELTTQQKLNWLAKNAAILKAPGSFDIGAGKRGADGKTAVTLTPEELEVAKQFKMTPEEYAKHK